MFARLLLIVLLSIAVAVAPAAAQVMTAEADARGIPTILPGGGNVGVGFAVPIDMARTVMDQLIRYGEVQRGRLGVLIQDLTPDLAEALGIDALNGAVVSAVEPDTPTARAGLAVGDVIAAVDRRTVEGSARLRQMIGLSRPGDRVTLSILRDGERIERAIELADAEAGSALMRQGAEDVLADVRLAPVDRGHPAWGRVEGTANIDVMPGSRAARAGLEPGDVITAVNRQPVDTVRDLGRALGDAPGTVALTVWCDGRLMLIVFRS